MSPKTSPNRVHAGVPTGGQFATQTRPEAVELLISADGAVASVRELGDVSNIHEGSRTPWGSAQWVSHTAPGIVQVSTAGHGGVKLSPERNRAIPVALRVSSGWYEEDCEAGIAVMYHPEGFPNGSDDMDTIRDRARQSVIDWFPGKYETAFGVELDTGVSHQKDQWTWGQLHADDESVISARGFGDDLPEGMVAVTVARGGRLGSGNADDERVLLVPGEDYDDDANKHPLGKHHGSFVVDPSKDYQDITPSPKPPLPPRPRYRGIDTSQLTESQRYRAERDLAKQWRFGDGQVKSTRQVIEEGGISGKFSTSQGNGRRKFYLSKPEEAEGDPGLGFTYALEVPKAVWDAVDAPDK
jgi:hypothetical protein